MATGIYKRGKVWWVRYTGLDGKQKRESSNSEEHKAAISLLADRQKTISGGKEPEIKKIPNYSFRELAAKYQAWIEGRQNSAKIKGYIIGQLLIVFGDIQLKRFNTAMTDQLQTDLISKKYKPSSNNKVLNILKHMFSKAVEWDMVDEDILKRIRKVKPLRDDGKRLRYLSKEESQTLVSACDPHLKPIVITALNTGMRRGEILGLKWDEHIDLRHGFILLNKTKNGERREIPINNTLRSILKGLTRRLDIPYAFYDPTTGNPYQNVKRSFKTALRKVEIQKCPDCNYQKPRLKTKEDAENCPQCNVKMVVFKGIDDFHFHDLRHTFASHLVMAGVDITTVSKLLGHKSLTMTLRYSHLAPSHMVKAVDILDSTLNEKTISTKLAQFNG
jgi:integrase